MRTGPRVSITIGSISDHFEMGTPIPFPLLALTREPVPNNFVTTKEREYITNFT